VTDCSVRVGQRSDLNALLALEASCFSSDRLSRRSFLHHLKGRHSVLLVAWCGDSLAGYALLLLQRGTRLARVYSLAVAPAARGAQLGEQLLAELEFAAAARGRVFMRLEVALGNTAAIALYRRCGYREFGHYSDYYDDHQDALRMHKVIRVGRSLVPRLAADWYPQTTDFTCGPAALMMAMAALDSSVELVQPLELQLWRESTTIFMTSGLGGTHPFGLALAAQRRGFCTQVVLNSDQPLFVDGVRSEGKKAIVAAVHREFERQCQEAGIRCDYREPGERDIDTWLTAGSAVLMLISTYRLDGKKVPHWVLVTGIDDHVITVHDPDVEERWQQPIDCQHLPIARADFAKMASFGSARLRCAIVLTAVG